MPRAHGRTYWIVVILATVASVVLLATVLAPLVRRGWGNKDAQLEATKDSLVAARTQTAEAIRQMRERDQAWREQNHLLDSLLRTPPKVLYVRRPPSEPSTALLGDTVSHDLASGDTLMPVVPLPVYEALAKGCGDNKLKCEAAVAQKDVVIADKDKEIARQGEIIVQQDQKAKRVARATFLGRLRDIGLGALGGYGACRF